MANRSIEFDIGVGLKKIFYILQVQLLVKYEKRYPIYNVNFNNF